MSQKVLTIAHRGFSEKFPENTLIAFQEAVTLAVDMIELDVQLTKDRQVVVHHDEELGRTNGGTGWLKEHTLQDLKALDAGSWLDQKFSGETIPLLEEVLDLVKDQVGVNIEIKASAYEEQETTDAIEHQVADLVQQKGLTDSVIVSSFQPKCLRRLRRKGEGLRLALLDSGKPKLWEWVKEIQPYSYHTYYRRVTLEDVEQARQAQLPLYVYTVNTPQDMETMIAMGVDGIITNAPDVLKALLEQYRTH